MKRRSAQRGERGPSDAAAPLTPAEAGIWEWREGEAPPAHAASAASSQPVQRSDL